MVSATIIIIDCVGVTLKKVIVTKARGFSSNVNQLNVTVVTTVGFLSALSTPFCAYVKQ